MVSPCWSFCDAKTSVQVGENFVSNLSLLRRWWWFAVGWGVKRNPFYPQIEKFICFNLVILLLGREGAESFLPQHRKVHLAGGGRLKWNPFCDKKVCFTFIWPFCFWINFLFISKMYSQCTHEKDHWIPQDYRLVSFRTQLISIRNTSIRNTSTSTKFKTAVFTLPDTETDQNRL